VKPSRDAFRKLAKEDPERLVRWIGNGTLLDAHLADAAEILGEDASRSYRFIPALEILLNRESAVVREGAVCGLGRMLHDLRAVLDTRRCTDTSSGVRLAAADVLEDLRV